MTDEITKILLHSLESGYFDTITERQRHNDAVAVFQDHLTPADFLRTELNYLA